MTRILVAGIGNIFQGDDAFGVEVAQRLARRPLPDGVKVVDFGIRGIDLTYALLDGYQLVILADAVQRGELPGTVTIIEPEWPGDGELEPESLAIVPHDLDPAKVLHLVRALGGHCDRLVLVGCEPATLGDEIEGRMGLSPAVEAAVDAAVIAIEKLIAEVFEEETRALPADRRATVMATLEETK
jgi:hydrogenase maturation protease